MVSHLHKIETQLTLSKPQSCAFCILLLSHVLGEMSKDLIELTSGHKWTLDCHWRMQQTECHFQFCHPLPVLPVGDNNSHVKRYDCNSWYCHTELLWGIEWGCRRCTCNPPQRKKNCKLIIVSFNVISQTSHRCSSRHSFGIEASTQRWERYF